MSVPNLISMVAQKLAEKWEIQKAVKQLICVIDIWLIQKWLQPYLSIVELPTLTGANFITMSFIDKLNYYSKRKSFKYGIPFLIMMVAGSFGLQQFSNLRY